jgi:hypothetical protein
MDNSEPHPLDPDSKLNPEERVVYRAFQARAEWADVYDWAVATEATTIVSLLHSVDAHVCIGDGCPWVSHRDPLPTEARARVGDPKVSHVAADSIGNMKERHRAVLQIAQTFADAFTYDELIHRYESRRENGYSYGKRTPTFVLDLPKMEPQSIRSRCAELRRAGWLEQAGRGLSDAGRPCNTWRVIR